MKRSNLIIGILFIVSSLFRLFSTKSNSFLSSLDWLSIFLKERKFNLFGFVPNSIKKKKKEKFNPTIVEFISNFSFVFNLPFLHIRKTFYPELFKLTKSQLPFFVFEKKFFIFLRHHPTQIVPLSNLVWTSLSLLPLTFPFLSQIDFHFSLSLWCNRSTIIRYPRKKKKNWKADDDQGQSGDKAIGIIAKHYRLSFDRFHGWRVFVARFETTNYRSLFRTRANRISIEFNLQQPFLKRK